jgi:hypothetical protein
VLGACGGEVKVMLMVIFFPFFPSCGLHIGLHTEGGEFCWAA